MCVFGQATILWNSLQFVSSSSSSITCGSAFLSYYELNCCHQVVVIHINIYFLHVDDCCAECWQPLYFLSFWGMQAVERREHYKYINESNEASSSLMKRMIQLFCVFEKEQLCMQKIKGVNRGNMDSPNQQLMGLFNRIY